MAVSWSYFEQTWSRAQQISVHADVTASAALISFSRGSHHPFGALGPFLSYSDVVVMETRPKGCVAVSGLSPPPPRAGVG